MENLAADNARLKAAIREAIKEIEQDYEFSHDAWVILKKALEKRKEEPIDAANVVWSDPGPDSDIDFAITENITPCTSQKHREIQAQVYLQVARLIEESDKKAAGYLKGCAEACLANDAIALFKHCRLFKNRMYKLILIKG